MAEQWQYQALERKKQDCKRAAFKRLQRNDKMLTARNYHYIRYKHNDGREKSLSLFVSEILHQSRNMILLLFEI